MRKAVFSQTIVTSPPQSTKMLNNTSDLGSFRVQEQPNTSPRGITLNADLHPLESFDFGPAAVQA